MHHADADVVLVVDADNAYGLIAHGERGGLLHGSFDFGFRYIGSATARHVLRGRRERQHHC